MHWDSCGTVLLLATVPAVSVLGTLAAAMCPGWALVSPRPPTSPVACHARGSRHPCQPHLPYITRVAPALLLSVHLPPPLSCKAVLPAF